MTDLDPKIDVDVAVAWAGTQTQLASVLGISKQTVSDWRRHKLEHLPPLYAHRFAELQRRQTQP